MNPSLILLKYGDLGGAVLSNVGENLQHKFVGGYSNSIVNFEHIITNKY